MQWLSCHFIRSGKLCHVVFKHVRVINSDNLNMIHLFFTFKPVRA